jgi:TolA-binding protein
MEDKIISPMQNFLPGALSKWILVSSIGLSLFLLTWPSYDLPAKYLTDKDITKLLMRLLSAGMPLLIGLIALIILQVRHTQKINRELNKSMSIATSLSIEIERINNEHIAKAAELTNHISGLRSELNRISREYSETLHKEKKNNEDYEALQQRYSAIELESNGRKFLLDNCQKELEILKKTPPPPTPNAWS